MRRLLATGACRRHMPISNMTVCSIRLWALSHRSQNRPVDTRMATATELGHVANVIRQWSAFGGGAAGAAAVEAAVAEGDAAGITPGSQARGAAARGEEAGDGVTADVQHLAVECGLQTAEGEAAGSSPAGRSRRPANQWAAATPAFCAAADPRRGRRRRCRRLTVACKRPGGQPDLAFEFGDRFAHPGRRAAS